MAILLEEIVQSLELWLKAWSRSEAPALRRLNLDPVPLVPGIAGSVLNAVDVEAGKEERVWVRILGADYAFQTKLWSRFDPSTGGKTCYLSELKAGKEVILVDQKGHQRTAIVGRVQIETRPLILVEAETDSNDQTHYNVLV